MIPEIKFRGLEIGTKEWVYGDLICLADGRHTIHIGNDTMVTVIPKTIGRFTGLQDKNKKDIYTDDIILTENGRKWKVSFELYEFGVSLLNKEGWNFKTYYSLREWISYGNTNEVCEVVSNIYEEFEKMQDEERIRYQTIFTFAKNSSLKRNEKEVRNVYLDKETLDLLSMVKKDINKCRSKDDPLVSIATLMEIAVEKYLDSEFSNIKEVYVKVFKNNKL